MSEIKEIPKEWIKVQLDTICLDKEGLRRGPFGSAIKKEFFVTNGYKVYEQSNAIYDDAFRGKYFIDENKYKELINYKVEPGDLIVSCSGTLGRISQIPNNAKPGIINQALLRIRLLNDLILKKYFLYFFRSVNFQRKIFAQSQGTAMSNLIGIKDFKEIELLLPPIPEQHRIVAKIEELFSSLDKGIESLKIAQAQLKTYRQAVLKWAFEGKLTNTEVCFFKVGNKSELITKGSSPKWQGFNYIEDSSQLLFITSENIRDNFIDITDPKYLSLGFNNRQKRSILKKGDVLFNLVGASIGRAAIFNIDKIANINQAVAIIRLTNEVNRKYLCYYLNSEVAKQIYLKKVVDVARANLSLADVSNIMIPSPPTLAEQQVIISEIEAHLSVCDKLEESIIQSLAQAEALRQSILKKAFEGKLVPQDPSDEPASALLERIKLSKGQSQSIKKSKKCHREK